MPRFRIHSPAIRYFDAVRRAGSIREAARRLNVASSAVNRQILKLEAEIGSPLFDRISTGLRLTATGEIVARHAIVVLQDADRATSEVDALRGLRSGHVEIATIEGVCCDLLPMVIEQVRRQFPGITIGVSIMGSGAVPRLLVSAEADLGLAFSLPRAPEFRQLAVGRFRLGAVMTPDHPLASNPTLTLAACRNFPTIAAKAELSIHQQLGDMVSRKDGAVIQSGSIELGKELARRNVGIAFQTRLGLEQDLAAGQLVHIPLAGPIVSELGLYVRQGRHLTPAMDAVARLLSDEIAVREQADG